MASPHQIYYMCFPGVNFVRYTFRNECSERKQLQDDTERRLAPWLPVYGIIL